MLERVIGHKSSIRAFIDREVKARLFTEMRSIREKEDFAAAITNFFETINVKVKYEQSNNSDRKLLGTSGGLIIANHPGYLPDTFSILLALKEAGREDSDIKLVLNSDNYKLFSKYLGEGLFEKVSGNKKENEQTISRLQQHMSAGGVAVIYPSAGAEQETGKLLFRGSAKKMIRELHHPHDMVYAFMIEQSDVIRLTEGMNNMKRFAKSARRLPLMNIRRDELNVRERHSDAQEWIAQLTSVAPERQNEAFTNHYLEVFNKKSD